MEYDSNEILTNLLEILETEDETFFNDSALRFYTDFINLPKDIQVKLFNALLDDLKVYKNMQIDNENKKICEETGHSYSSWYEKVSFKNYRGSTFKNKIWCKKCSKCGDINFTFIKPNELIILDKETESENDRKVLQKKINKFN